MGEIFRPVFLLFSRFMDVRSAVHWLLFAAGVGLLVVLPFWLGVAWRHMGADDRRRVLLWAAALLLFWYGLVWTFHAFFLNMRQGGVI